MVLSGSLIVSSSLLVFFVSVVVDIELAYSENVVH